VGGGGGGGGGGANRRNCEYLLTYLLTLWCRVRLEKLTGLQLVKIFPAFQGTRKFITALTSVRHLSSRLLSKNLKIKIHRTIILPVVLCGCETWSLTLREERKLKLFENMVLRRIFGSRKGEVTGEWRRLRNEELNDM